MLSCSTSCLFYAAEERVKKNCVNKCARHDGGTESTPLRIRYSLPGSESDGCYASLGLDPVGVMVGGGEGGVLAYTPSILPPLQGLNNANIRKYLVKKKSRK
jgi:hypothetical protein